MGGRRATSLSEVFGPRKIPPGLEKRLHSALSDRDPQAISDAAASLATKALPRESLDSYITLLVPFVRQHLAKRTPPEDIRRDVRREWARLKKLHSIDVRRVISDAVVQAAEDFLKAKR
jgi:hypothetical protein